MSVEGQDDRDGPPWKRTTAQLLIEARAAVVESEAREQEWREKAAEDNAAIVADTKEILALRAREAVLVEALKELREAGGTLYRAVSEAENAGAFNVVPLGTSVHWLEALDLYHAALAGVVEAETDGRTDGRT